jgi:iron complex transport system substrate-binding protein
MARSSFIVQRSAFVLAVLVLACGERAPTTHTDDLGRAVAIPSPVARVVTLSPNLTEMVFAVGAGAKIVAVDDHSNFPVAARALPRVGGMQPRIEKIAALKPDLVLASTEGNHPNLEPALQAAGIPLIVVRTDRLAHVPRAMTFTGALLDGPETAAAVTALQRRLREEARSRKRRTRVLFVVWTDPLYVAGRETFTDDLFALTGAENAVRVPGWPQYSLESLAQSPPDVLLYPRASVTPQQIEALLARLPSARPQVVPVDDDLFQRPGPRVFLAARTLNAILDVRESR